MSNNDLLNSLKGMLGDNADEKISAVMNMLKSDNVPENISENIGKVENDINVIEQKGSMPVGITNNQQQSFSPESLEYISKIKSIVDEMGSTNDPRSNLLLSLRPYMRDTRKKSIDNAVKLLNLSRFSGIFKI